MTLLSPATVQRSPVKRLPRLSLPVLSSGLAFLIYLVTRLWRLPDFPIYFFVDEAVQSLFAANLVQSGWRAPNMEMLPTYFAVGGQYKMGLSVYWQVLPWLIFQRFDIWITRGAAALGTLLAALALYAALRQVFQSRRPWLGVLVLAAIPAWFLHSRTAFETALAASFYAAFLVFYLLYRTRDAHWVYAACLSAAAAFYTYPPDQIVIAMSGLLLFLSDIPYHWRSRRVLLPALGMGALLAVPYARFLINHPGENARHLADLGSYWLADKSVWAKIGIYLGNYAAGLNPSYWFFPNLVDAERHILRDYGNLGWWMLPFFGLGLGLAVWRAQRAEYRIILLALLAAPAGAATVGIGVTRILVWVIPAALLIALGMDAVTDWLGRQAGRLPRLGGRYSLASLPGVLAFVGLGGASLFMTWDALTNGPLWFNQYGLYGMQYGARQVFHAIDVMRHRNTSLQVILSPDWANGTDALARFFLPAHWPVQTDSPRAYWNVYRPFDPLHTLFVMTPEEYTALPRSKFKKVDLVSTLPYPDGHAGFYFVKLMYVDDIQSVLEKEQTQRNKLQEDQFDLDGRKVILRHSKLDMGKVENLFDRNLYSVIRSDGINPMILELEFPVPRPISSVKLRVGSAATLIYVEVWADGADQPRVLQVNLPAVVEMRDAVADLEGQMQVKKLRLTVTTLEEPADTHVHVWELSFK